MAFDLRWYQHDSIQSIFDYYGDHGRDEAGNFVEANPLVALPTGTGKSLCIGEFARQSLIRYPMTRGLMLTHVKELIEQNAKTIYDIWPQAPLGIYSSGLGQRVTDAPLIYGGIQSVVKVADEIGRRDWALIDEAHLIGPNADTRYMEFFAAMRMKNPWFRVIGFTATPYRLGLGYMTNGNIFTDVCYDLTNMDGFNRLLGQGYLCPIIPARTENVLDTSGVGLGANGDFNNNQLQASVDKYEITLACLKEVVRAGHNRASWVIFASGIDHAEHITEMLNNIFGVPTVCVHSETDKVHGKGTRDKNIELFKTGAVRCIVNKDILTTGFDHKPIDLIAVLRPTMSTGLWVQMLGRGTRPYDWTDIRAYIRGFNYVKHNCLVLDFAQNVRRLGPINDPVIPKMKGAGKPGDAPVKECPDCPAYVHSTTRECPMCGHIWEYASSGDSGLDTTSSSDELIRSDLPQIETYDVTNVIYDTFRSPRTSAVGLKVAYHTGIRTFYETIWFEGVKPYAIHKAHDWYKMRYAGDPPDTTYAVMRTTPFFRRPSRIRVWVNAKPTPEIQSYEFTSEFANV